MSRCRPRVVLVMAPTGCGKSTVGARLAAELAVPFLEADDFCPPEARAKMTAGIPLDGADRRPCLKRLNRALHAAAAPTVVLAGSAQTERDRARVCAGLPERRIVYLHGEAAVVRAHLGAHGALHAGVVVALAARVDGAAGGLSGARRGAAAAGDRGGGAGLRGRSLIVGGRQGVGGGDFAPEVVDQLADRHRFR